jgi:hypothetical protein
VRESGDQEADAAECGQHEAGGQSAGHAPPLAAAAGEVAEHHEPGRVEPEREGVLLRRQPVDPLENVGGPAEIREQCGVDETLREHCAHEAAVGEKQPEVTGDHREAGAGARIQRQGLGEAEGDP